jgi:hypothetical protein
VTLRDSAELFVHQRHQLVQCRGLALAPSHQ